MQDIRESFQYDRLDRLTTVTGQIGRTSYNHTLTYGYAGESRLEMEANWRWSGNANRNRDPAQRLRQALRVSYF